MPAPPEPSKPGHNSSIDEEKPKQLDCEVKEMVRMLTHLLANLRRGLKSGLSNLEASSKDESVVADEGGVRIITLAGTNTGATMRSELEDKSIAGPQQNHGFSSPSSEPAAGSLSTHVNSNFQAINNSIMLGGSHWSKNPGVHMDINDFLHEEDRDHHLHKGHKHDKHAERGMNNDEEMGSPVRYHYSSSE